MDERSQRIADRFERPLLVAALLVVPVLVIDGADLDGPWPEVATTLNWAIWLAFAVELVVMLAVVPDRRAWLRRHPLEVAIVLLTPPFLPASLDALRVFRLLPLVLSAARLRRMLTLEGVRDAAVLALVTVLAGGAAFAAVEPEEMSTWDGVWWAITTVTTVGYGDFAPTTDAGRAIAIAVMVTGIGFVALLTAAAADRFVAGGRTRDAEIAELRAQLDRIEQLLRERA